VISAPYDGKLWDFDVHYWDLWELATDLLGNPSLFPHFTFDAQHLSKFNGKTFVCFVDEPSQHRTSGISKYILLHSDFGPFLFYFNCCSHDFH